MITLFNLCKTFNVDRITLGVKYSFKTFKSYSVYFEKFLNIDLNTWL